MSNAYDRLRQAREQAGYASAADAGRALDVPYPTYAAHENGSRGFSDHLDRYARAFKVRAEWLRNGTGPMKPGQREPILQEIDQLSPEKRQQVVQFIEFLKSA